MALTGPLDRTDPAGRRVGGPRVVLRPLRSGRPWDAESLDAALRLRQLTDRTAHGRIPFVDQDPLRGRQLPREFLEEGRLVLVEALQFSFDLLLAGEKAPDGGDEEPHPLREGHVPPHAPEDRPGVLVDEGDLAADLLRGPRRGDHLVADLDAILAGDPDLELREEGEGGDAAGPRGPAHQGMVPNGIQLDGHDLRTASEDFRSD